MCFVLPPTLPTSLDDKGGVINSTPFFFLNERILEAASLRPKKSRGSSLNTVLTGVNEPDGVSSETPSLVYLFEVHPGCRSCPCTPIYILGRSVKSTTVLFRGTPWVPSRVHHDPRTLGIRGLPYNCHERIETTGACRHTIVESTVFVRDTPRT